MNITPLQSNFSSGEISPDMRERTETDGYRKSVGKMLNCISTPQGPAYSRFPFVFGQEFPGEETGRIVTIQASANAYIIAVLVDKEIFFFADSGQPLQSGFVANARFVQFGTFWTVITDGNNKSTVTFQRHNCEMIPNDKNNSFAGIKQNITIITTGASHAISVVSDVENLSDQLIVRIGTTEGASDVLNAVAATNNSLLFFTPTQTDLWIEVVNDENFGNDNPINVTTVDVYEDVAIPSVSTPYLATDLFQLQFIEAPSNDIVFITHHNYPPYYIQYNDISGTATFNIVGFTSAPTEWGDNNWPSTGVVHRNRMWYANTINEPEQLWASVLGTFTDFTIGTTETDGFSVVAEHYGAIEWMLSTKDLILGSSTGEYIVTAEAGVIFIGDIDISRQSTYGSVAIRAKQIGDKIVYIARDRIKMYAMQYNRDAQNWLSEELSFAADSIMKPGAVDLAWEKDPVSLFWVVLDNGTMACMSYNRPMDVVGWHQHDTQGQFKSVATGDRLGITDVVVLVNRGDGNLKLEVTRGDGSPMDSRISVFNDPPATVITDLGPLEGKTVQVITDGAVHPDRVVTGGQITLQLASELTQVGLGYKKQITTLPFDQRSNKGSARAYTKRYKDIYVKLLNSNIPFINGQLAPIRHPVTPMGTPEPKLDGLVKIINTGNDREALVDIVQEGPLTLAVQGIYGEVTQDKM